MAVGLGRRNLERGLLQITLVAAVAGLLTTGCKGEEEQRRETAALAAQIAKEQERLRAEEELRKAEEEKRRLDTEKERVVATPSQFLESSELEYFDKGIINDYRQLTSARVLNKSRFALRDIQGEVDWIDDNGQKVGSVPFFLKGSIPAGDTKHFTKEGGTLINGTLETSANRAKIRFTSVKLVEGS